MCVLWSNVMLHPITFTRTMCYYSWRSKHLSTHSPLQVTVLRVPLYSIRVIISLQWICTKAVRCTGNTLIIISTWLIFCGLINDMTPTTMHNCSAGLVQVWSDALSSQGLLFLSKTQRWHQKCAFWHCSTNQGQPAKEARCVASLEVDSKQWPTQMCAATASTLRNEMHLHLDRAKYGTIFNCALVWSDFKELWDASTNRRPRNWVPQHFYKYLCLNPNMSSVFHPGALGFVQPLSVSAYEFLLACRQSKEYICSMHKSMLSSWWATLFFQSLLHSAC